ncbi:MAG: hypothetical protein NTZ50_04260 [Chloroflexi bacterium]|nr:hypothetical protein [Chloroflexota bacterium]
MMKTLWQYTKRAAFVLLLMTLLSYETPARTERAGVLDGMLGNARFDLASWVARAAFDKLAYEFSAPHRALSEAEQLHRVRDLMRRIAHVQQLEAQIRMRYTDPTERDPAAATAALRSERDALRSSIDADRPIVEAILQAQAETILREEDFGLLGQPMPPLRFRLTQLPFILIISRRDRIDRIDQRELTVGLAVDDMDRIERSVDSRFDVSSLVTPIGGYGTYPTMLPETSSLRFIVETALHEWTHNYLFFSWVGLSYDRDPTARIINETAATIVQHELGARMMQHFYPDTPDTPDEAGRARLTAALTSDAVTHPTQRFNFNTEMRLTRMHVDELLAAGHIVDAERYMEQRRAVFVTAGYELRKLNQAYFAFYGAYNAEPGGAPAAGKDTVGPAVQELRARSPSIGEFVRAVAQLRGKP